MLRIAFSVRQPIQVIAVLCKTLFFVQFEWPALRDGHRQTMILYRFGYLPAGVFNRWQVRLFQFSDQEIIWKNGSVLRKDGHIALIEEIK